MGNRDELEHLLAWKWECPEPVVAEGLDRVFAAVKQALAEFGVPEHPGGRCPATDCNCLALADDVMGRAYELLGLPRESFLQDAASWG
jgi:hypothetical protein